MNTSVWGYLFMVLGIFGIFLINVFGEVTIKNEQNYYSLKEVTKSAMEDAVDQTALLYGVSYDGVTFLTDEESMHCYQNNTGGTVRIIKQRFMELFILKLSSSVNSNNDYTITFNDIDECPPKVTVTVTSTESLSFIQKAMGVSDSETVEDADITNVITGILESTDTFN